MSNAIAFPAAGTSGGLGDTISRNVRILMATRDVSQMKLATVLGLSQAAVSRRLRGATEWDTGDIDKLCRAFGVTAVELVTQLGPPNGVGRTETGGLPRMDSNHQPAGYVSALVTPPIGPLVEPAIAPVVPLTPDRRSDDHGPTTHRPDRRAFPRIVTLGLAGAA